MRERSGGWPRNIGDGARIDVGDDGRQMPRPARTLGTPVGAPARETPSEKVSLLSDAVVIGERIKGDGGDDNNEVEEVKGGGGGGGKS